MREKLKYKKLFRLLNTPVTRKILSRGFNFMKTSKESMMGSLLIKILLTSLDSWHLPLLILNSLLTLSKRPTLPKTILDPNTLKNQTDRDNSINNNSISKNSISNNLTFSNNHPT